MNVLIINVIDNWYMDNPRKSQLKLPGVVSFKRHMIRSEATQGSGETAPQCPLGLSRSDWGLNINRILISVERAASGHVVNLVLYALKDFGIFLGPFCRDSVDNVGVLGDGGEDGVDELDDVNHVLLHKAA